LTANAQPALLAASVAALRVLQAHTGARAEAVAGHSVGEYAALVCAKVLAFEDALRLVRCRGELMQKAFPPGQGGMTAVLGLDRDAVEELCRETAGEDILELANDNAPRQLVVAGHAAALDRLTPLVRRRGGKAVPLNVSAPFHCALMRAAGEQLRKVLRTVRFAPPSLPVLGNVLAQPYRADDDVPDLLARPASAPVQWTATVRHLKALGVREFLEVGPGQVLTRLVAQTEPELAVSSVATSTDVSRIAARTAPKCRPPLDTRDWVRRGHRLGSPDGRRCCFDDGLEWDAAEPGACGF
jgi:[acyl-carrier-protein] S-malonyltransferase